MKLCFLGILCLLCASIGWAGEAAIASVNKIWDFAPHSAFTDLTRYKGQWFCAFREGEAHVPVANKATRGDGVIRILTSQDGRAWTSAALLAEETIDLRDPHFSITPDGRLMLILGGSHDGLLWMSYNSSHEGKTSIYLATCRPGSSVAKEK